MDDWGQFSGGIGGGIAFYINDQLPSRPIKIENPSDIEILAIEITIRKKDLTKTGYSTKHKETCARNC